MTQTLQDALLKAGLVSKEKLKKAEIEKKQAERAERTGARMEARKEPPKKAVPGKAPPRKVTPPREFRPPAKKSLGFIEGKHHHHLRTDCEACGKNSPDVEYYQHHDKRLEKFWLCVRCADDRSIPDSTRMTMQSQHAQSGLFRRNYGATKVFK